MSPEQEDHGRRSEAAQRLPWLGLGLSSNLDARAAPHPYRLLDSEPGIFDYVEYSAPLSLEQARRHASLFTEMWERRADIPVLFHPVHLNLYGPALESEEALADLEAHARAVGSAWVGNDVGWWHTHGEPFPGYLYVAPPLTAAGVADAAAHALHVQSHLSLPLLLENPALIAARGELHVLDFMAALHARTGLPLLLDLGHLLSHQLARGLPPTAGIEGFPLDRVVEIHLAGGVVSRRGERRYYADDHTQPVREELFELLAEVLPRCTSLRAVTFEGDGHPPEVAALTLRRLRPLVPPRVPGTPHMRRGDARAAPPAAIGPRPSFTAATDPISAFEESYGVRPPSEDPAGVEAEVDFRLAVLAQALDRAFPVSRLLLAPTRAELEDFVGSSVFRACFTEPRRTVAQAFRAWATSRVRELGDPSVEAALAMETLGASSELTEARFAARALRRHLADRAWVSGRVELEALDALRQVVRRSFAARQFSVPPRSGLWRGSYTSAFSRGLAMATIERHISRELIALDGSASCTEAARLMTERRIGAVGVREEGRIVGVVTERDLASRVVGRGDAGSMPIRQAMRRDVPTVQPNASESDCSNLMRDHYTRHLLVEQDGQVLGIISMRDVIRLMLDDKQWLIDQLQRYINGA